MTAEQQQDDQTGAMTERERLARLLTLPDVWEACTDPDARDCQRELIAMCYADADRIIAAGFTIQRAAPSDAVVALEELLAIPHIGDVHISIYPPKDRARISVGIHNPDRTQRIDLLTGEGVSATEVIAKALADYHVQIARIAATQEQVTP
jgi:hypothetical protein